MTDSLQWGLAEIRRPTAAGYCWSLVDAERWTSDARKSGENSVATRNTSAGRSDAVGKTSHSHCERLPEPPSDNAIFDRLY